MHAPYIFADMPAHLAVELDASERKFLQEYIVDLDEGEAARRAELYKGTNPTPARLKACGDKFLKRNHVRLALHWLQSYRGRHSEVTAEKVLKRLWSIATADASEITSVRVFSCRHCHGDDFEYQWINPTEFRFEKARLPSVTDDGGYGYNPERRPHAECPRCKGLGERAVYLTDTRDYSADAKLLYRGAKETRHGIEVLTHDSMKAMDMVARILGMYGDADPNEGQMKIIVQGGLPD